MMLYTIYFNYLLFLDFYFHFFVYNNEKMKEYISPPPITTHPHTDIRRYNRQKVKLNIG